MTTPEIRPFREQIDDHQWRINFSPAQERLMKSEARIPVMQCGVQAGKTSCLVEILAKEISERGPGDYLFASPTFPLMEKRAIPELQERFIAVTKGEYDYQPGKHRFVSRRAGETGQPETIIWLGSADNPESLASTTLKGAAFDEAAQTGVKREAFNQIFRGLAVNQGRLFIGTTIYSFSDAYRYEIYDKWKNGDPRFELIFADSIDNPAFPEEEYYQQMKDLPYWKFNMLYRGIYERPAGLVYDAFNPDTQVIDSFHIPSEWLRYTGHDFGPNNTAAVWLAQDPATGLIYVYRDYHRGGLTVGQHSEEFKRVSQNEEIRRRVGGAWGEEEARYAYSSAGWPISKPPLRDVEAGIDRVYSFVAKNQIFVFRDSHQFINELMSYSRELDENYETTEKIQNKARFHLMDALRYIISSFAPERANTRKTAPMVNRYSTRYGLRNGETSRRRQRLRRTA